MIKNKDIILYDLETSYTVSATWGLYDQNVAKVIREPFIISIGHKLLGSKVTKVISIADFPLYKKDKFNDRDLMIYIHKLFKDKKIAIAHNGNAFDWKWITGRFAIHGLEPLPPIKHIDTLLVSRNKFRFNSNKLNDLGKYLKLGEKIQTGGIDLWYKCIELFDKKSWNLMKKYNKQDVVLLEKVYLKLLPFITNHPNLALLSDKMKVCPNCESTDIQKRGFAFTRVMKYQRWQCQTCHSWHQSPLIEDDEDDEDNDYLIR